MKNRKTSYLRVFFYCSILLISITSKGQSIKATPLDLVKAKEKPIWSFHVSLLDSIQSVISNTIYTFDTLLIFVPSGISIDNGKPPKHSPKPYSRTIPFSETG